MDGGGEERDYLVRAQPETDPASFGQAVREAFAQERDALLAQDIAEDLGVDKSRVSQIFRDPGALDTKTLDRIMARVEGPEHRRRILRAWVLARYGTDPGETSRGRLVSERVSGKVLRRIDRQIRESRLETAARTASEALARTDDATLREQLLDRAFFARQRLDAPGRAMAVARLIALGAAKRGDARRLAAAHLDRARVLMSLPDARPGEVLPVFDQAERIVAGQPPAPDPAPPYALATEERIQAGRTAARIGFIERGLLEQDEAFLREALAALLRTGRAKVPHQARYHALQTAARAHLLLGETAAAQEALERAFEAGGLRNLQAYEMCGLVQGRIMREAEGKGKALWYLRRVRDNCLVVGDRYHARLADHDLARLEGSLFPKAGSGE